MGGSPLATISGLGSALVVESKNPPPDCAGASGESSKTSPGIRLR